MVRRYNVALVFFKVAFVSGIIKVVVVTPLNIFLINSVQVASSSWMKARYLQQVLFWL